MLAALDVQGRVIKALFLREMKTRFGEKRLGFLWAFVEPIVHVIGFMLIWKIFGRMGPHGVDPMLFLITGIVPYIMFSNILHKVMNSIAANKALLVFPQIKTIDFILSRIVVEYTTYGVVFIFLICFMRYIGYEFVIADPLGVLLYFTLMALFGGGLGYILMPILSVLPAIEHFQRLLVRVLYITSGIFFAIDKLPNYIREYISYNPVLQIMQMLRTSFFEQMHMGMQVFDLGYILLLISTMWLFGIILTKKLMIRILEEK